MPVVAGFPGSAMLVGRVVDGHARRRPTVQLIIDPDLAAAGVIQEQAREAGARRRARATQTWAWTTSSGGTGESRDEPQPVFTAGYELNGQTGLYPPGLLDRDRSRVVLEPRTRPRSIVTVRPAVDFASLEYVLVLQSPGREERRA